MSLGCGKEQQCDHILGLDSIHRRTRSAEKPNGNFSFELAQAVICLSCTSALRDYWPTRTERLDIWRRLREIVLPPLSVDEEGKLYQWTQKVPCTELDAQGNPTTGTIYIHVVYDPEGNPHNVIIDMGHAGRGMNAAKAAIGLFVHHLFEWGCSVEEVSRILIGHASAAGPARWVLQDQFVFSLEDAVGKVLRLAMVGKTVEEFLMWGIDDMAIVGLVVGKFLRQYGGAEEKGSTTP